MALKLYPAMDLLDGACVRLAQGKFSEQTMYSRAPLEVAARFQALGARALHVVDLQGARDPKARQTGLLAALLKQSSMEIQVGGGVRSLEDAQQLLGLGARRVVFGSLAVQHPDALERIIKTVGPERITLALDLSLADSGEPEIAIKGWQDSSPAQVDTVLARYRSLGVAHVLCTDIQRDGMLSGPNIELYKQLLARHSGVELQASGGIRDLRDLKELDEAGVPAAILGRSIYQGTLSLAEALATC